MLEANPWRPNLFIVSGRPFLWMPDVIDGPDGNPCIGELEAMLFPLGRSLCRRWSMGLA